MDCRTTKANFFQQAIPPPWKTSWRFIARNFCNREWWRICALCCGEIHIAWRAQLSQRKKWKHASKACAKILLIWQMRPWWEPEIIQETGDCPHISAHRQCVLTKGQSMWTRQEDYPRRNRAITTKTVRRANDVQFHTRRGSVVFLQRQYFWHKITMDCPFWRVSW